MKLQGPLSLYAGKFKATEKRSPKSAAKHIAQVWQQDRKFRNEGEGLRNELEEEACRGGTRRFAERRRIPQPTCGP